MIIFYILINYQTTFFVWIYNKLRRTNILINLLGLKGLKLTVGTSFVHLKLMIADFALDNS